MTELLGTAMGAMGMSYGDFCRLTLTEFRAAYKAWGEVREEAERSAWERMRTVAWAAVQPHVKKKMSPRSLIPLPWDKRKTEKKAVSREEDKAALEKTVAELRALGVKI